MLFICYPKCSTCKKAQAYLEERGIPLYAAGHQAGDSQRGRAAALAANERITAEKIFQHQRPFL